MAGTERLEPLPFYGQASLILQMIARDMLAIFLLVEIVYELPIDLSLNNPLSLSL